MESFFGTPKSKFFYLNPFQNLNELEAGLVHYIHDYNHGRITLKLKWLSPVLYRTQPSCYVPLYLGSSGGVYLGIK